MSWSYEENVDNARTSMMSFRVYQEPENCEDTRSDDNDKDRLVECEV